MNRSYSTADSQRRFSAFSFYLLSISFAGMALLLSQGGAVAADVPFSAEQVITEDPDGPGMGAEGDADSPAQVVAADMDNDGDLDPISVSTVDSKVAWYRNNGGGSYGPQQVISTTTPGVRAVFADDLDGDEKQDLLVGGGTDEINWYENLGSGGIFGGESPILRTGEPIAAVFAADIDDDGDLDVVYATSNDDEIAWIENTGGFATWSLHIISTASVDFPESIFVADVNGDGDLDVVSASSGDNKIAWFENDGTPDVGLWTEHSISTAADGAQSVVAADINGDGEMDVLSASENDDKIAWYENDGASPPVWTVRVITEDPDAPLSGAEGFADGARSVYAADVDGDGDVDVLSASENDNKIAWYENDGASPPVWTAREISTAADGAESVFAADINGDGEMDVLSASKNDDKIAWYENLTITNNEIKPDIVFANVSGRNRLCLNDGSGGFTCTDISTDTNNSKGVALGDLDGDGDQDVVFANTVDLNQTGQRNRVCLNNGSGSFTCNDVSTEANRSFGVALRDLDGDTVIDALFANHGNRNRVCLNDGTGSFTCSDIETLGKDTFGVALGDLSGDTDIDAVFANFGVVDRVCHNNGTGGFPCSDVGNDTNNSRGVALGDVNGEDGPDALFANSGENRVCLNNGSGSFNPCTIVNSDTNSSHGVALGDLDHANGLDAVIANHCQRNRVCLNNGSGSGSFTCTNVSAFTGCSHGVALGDVDGDGVQDAVFPNSSGNENQVCLNDGSGSFTCSDISTDNNVSEGVALGSVVPISVVTVLPGLNVMDSLRGGSTVPGGLDTTFDDTAGGTFTAQYITTPSFNVQDLVNDPGPINFGIPTDPVQLWEINYDETLTDTLTIVFGYEDLNLAPGFTEDQFAIHQFHAGAWSRPSQTINTGNNTITVTISVLSQFVLGADVPTSSTWDFFGTAEGGTVDFMVGAVSLQVVTTAGQTPAQVAAAVAAAINADATLSAAGITATADGDTVTTNGSFTSREINDPGLFDVDPSIPTLSGPGLLLFLLLATAGFLATRRRRRAVEHG